MIKDRKRIANKLERILDHIRNREMYAWSNDSLDRLICGVAAEKVDAIRRSARFDPQWKWEGFESELAWAKAYIVGDLRKLKVWDTAIFHKGRQVDAIVAAKSRAEAGRLLDVSDHIMRGWATVTQNPEANRVALSQPGVVFINANGTNWPKVWIVRD